MLPYTYIYLMDFIVLHRIWHRVLNTVVIWQFSTFTACWNSLGNFLKMLILESLLPNLDMIGLWCSMRSLKVPPDDSNVWPRRTDLESFLFLNNHSNILREATEQYPRKARGSVEIISPIEFSFHTTISLPLVIVIYLYFLLVRLQTPGIHGKITVSR